MGLTNRELKNLGELEFLLPMKQEKQLGAEVIYNVPD